jgi:putative serine protease PepD
MASTAKRTIAGIGAGLVIGLGAGVGGYSLVSNSEATSAEATTITTARTVAASAGAMSVNQIYRKAGPGTVDILVNTSSSGNSGFPFPGGGTAQAQGSGFVYDASGDIITNQHVVDGATAIKVRFPNGKSYSGTLVGSDPSTDVAVIKIDASSSDLKPLALADSSDVEVGDGVVAIGSPFGLAGTVTSGIVSALGRQMRAPNQYTINGAIQTDAAINHGNSGGPLLDLEGRVIGINAQIESDSGGNDGVGFAIPSNTVRTIVSQLISNGKVAHAFLGVGVATGSGGVRITEVRPDTPADKAGIQIGDVVTSIDGKTVTAAPALQSAIDAKKPGDQITVTYTRGSSEKTVKVTLGTRPA